MAAVAAESRMSGAHSIDEQTEFSGGEIGISICGCDLQQCILPYFRVY